MVTTFYGVKLSQSTIQQQALLNDNIWSYVPKNIRVVKPKKH